MAKTPRGDQPLSIGPVSPRKRRDETSQSIRMAIVSGQLSPGQHLKEIELSEALNISRPTLRESLVQLIHEGLLIEVPYKGIFVAEVTPADLRYVADVRAALESLAASYVREDESGRAMRVIRHALERHNAALDAANEVQAYETHIQLHRSFITASGNPLLTKVWPTLEAHIRMAIVVDQAARHDPRRDRELHERLVDVIEHGSDDEVRKAFDEHLRESAIEVATTLPERAKRRPRAKKPATSTR